MKWTNGLLSGLGMLALLSACQNEQSAKSVATATIPSGQALVEKSNERGEAGKLDFSQLSEIQRGSLQKKVDWQKLDMIVADVNSAAGQAAQDQQQLKNIMSNLLQANQKNNLQGVKLSLSSEPVSTGVFIFMVETEQKGDLSFQMYDEEGHQVAANSRVKFDKGTNYKALNVKGLESGTYAFRLRNDNGEQIMQRIQIQNQ